MERARAPVRRPYAEAARNGQGARTGKRDGSNDTDAVLDIGAAVGARQRLAARSAQHGTLADLAYLALQGGGSSEFLATAIQAVAGEVDADRGEILEYLPATSQFIGVSGSGDGSGDAPKPFAADPVLLATRAFGSRDPVFVTDFEAPRQPRAGLPRRRIGASLASVIAGPLSPFGVLSVHWRQARTFSSDDIDFVHLAAGIISLGIERKHSREQRQALLQRVDSAQEEARRSIAVEIHDDAVQVMTAASLELGSLRSSLSDAGQQEAARNLQETVALSIGRLRNLLFELAPPALEQNGLPLTLSARLQDLESDTGVVCSIESDPSAELTVESRTLLYRIFQEALANIRRHAKPAHVAVDLRRLDLGVQMTISDDGAGFILADALVPVKGHIGLASMRERAEMHGGWWQVETAPGAGTKVVVWVPSGVHA